MSVVRSWYNEQPPNRFVPEFGDLVSALDDAYESLKLPEQLPPSSRIQPCKDASAEIAEIETRIRVLTALKPVWDRRCNELRETVIQLDNIYWERIGIPVDGLTLEDCELLRRGELDASRVSERREADLRRAQRSILMNPLRWPLLFLSWASGSRVCWGHAPLTRTKTAWNYLQRRIELSPRARFETLCGRYQQQIDLLHRRIVYAEHVLRF